jgi:hypothetical protein
VPSSAHQWLLVWAARRMVGDGFVVSGFDGSAPRDRTWSALPAPFTLNGVRADAWGQRPSDGRIAFGEAKTSRDVKTAHTRQQLVMLGHTRMKGSVLPCPVYIAIPRSAAYDLDRVLIDVGLIRAKNIIRLHIPDVLIEEYPHGSREGRRTSA